MKFGDIALKVSEKAFTFIVMVKPIQVYREDIRMSSGKLYHSLLYYACLPVPETFAYEPDTARLLVLRFRDCGMYVEHAGVEAGAHLCGDSENSPGAHSTIITFLALSLQVVHPHPYLPNHASDISPVTGGTQCHSTSSCDTASAETRTVQILANITRAELTHMYS